VRRGALAALCAGTVLAIAAAVPARAADVPRASHPARTPVQHVISLMQEGHSFDNYFGTYRHADGIPRHACMPVDPTVTGGRCIKPFHIDNQPIEDLSGSPDVARAQLNAGRMNGFISAITGQRGRVQPVVMGHYDDRDIPYYWNAADDYVLFDRFFGSALGGSLTNHMFWLTGGPGDKRGETVPDRGFTAPTIFDRLTDAGVSWKLYIQSFDRSAFRSSTPDARRGEVVRAPLLGYARFVDDPHLFKHIVSLDRFPRDLERNRLPAVSYVVSSGSREHPPGSLMAGQTLIRTLLNDLMRSRYWRSSAFTWTYDGAGGWYDHVKPPQVDRWGYGFRVPALLVSAYAKRGYIDHSTLDFTSILRFIEQNWGLRPLGERDRRANSLLGAFDFARPPREARFLTMSRASVRRPAAARTPVYAAYGIASAVALALILLTAAYEMAVRRRRAARLRGPSNRVTVGPWGEE
jgi:phospholipase C